MCHHTCWNCGACKKLRQNGNTCYLNIVEQFGAYILDVGVSAGKHWQVTCLTLMLYAQVALLLSEACGLGPLSGSSPSIWS